MKLKNKTVLKKVLYAENFDKIIFFNDGRWAEVGICYAGEQDGNNPVYQILRTRNYDLTHREIDVLVEKIEQIINKKIIVV